MTRRVLITGGAGFIGSHVADRLLAAGKQVRVLDNLETQVHGEGTKRPAYLDDRVELEHGDVRDEAALVRALQGVDSVVHLAAAVGVGQSMYELRRYVDINATGTATLLEALEGQEVDRLVVASSMSVYGEGLYRDPNGRPVHNAGRDPEDLARGRWEPTDDQGSALEPVRTPESKQPDLESVYALTKYDQERLCLMVGQARDLPTVALRFFNVYGPRQALGNPYTGVLAIFASRVLNDRPPTIFEDGHQQRDFVSVHDVARAVEQALDKADDAGGEVLNIGSGTPRSIRQVADAILEAMDRTDLSPEVTGEYRVGDVRHCFADVSRAQRVLDYRPRVGFDEGLQELVTWLQGQAVEGDQFDRMRGELEERRLVF